jgi:hypothetical protein
MTIRHIIVEGMDGTGKDGLITRFRAFFPEHTIHERASSSLGGPVDNLAQWVSCDLETIGINGPWIYNRHPAFSEPIYGPICRPRAVAPFDDPTYIHTLRQRLAKTCLVVWCLPPWSNVRHNVMSNPGAHMPGVAENARQLYEIYRRAAGDFPGESLYWDYTTSRIVELVQQIDEVFKR